MKKWPFIKKALVVCGCIVLSLVVLLAVHIYMVTRPKAPDANTVVMARLDIKQAVNQQDADKITAWLYEQKGISHVLCNPDNRIAIFTFFPVQLNADAVAARLQAQLGYQVARYVPTAAELKSGCPASAGPVSSRLMSYFKRVF